jgi:hypothetical protein
LLRTGAGEDFCIGLHDKKCEAKILIQCLTFFSLDNLSEEEFYLSAVTCD